MKKESFSYSFNTSKPIDEVFALLLNVPQWWSGLFEETITGKSHQVNDEFSFKAGGGVHYSKQKLIDLVPNQRVVWQVTDSHLNFLENPSEWNDTQIRFDIAAKDGNTTQITFTHDGLVPAIACYDQCSSAWTGYLNQLKKNLS